MKVSKFLKSFQAIVLAFVMVVLLVATPLVSVSAEEVHTQPADGVYVVTAGPSNSGSEWGQDVFRNLNIEVIEGKTYTFSALWKAGANDKTQIQINGVSITNGRYNVQNGATYNPFTGRITYTFTATSNTTSISLNNRDESIKRKDYSFADPKIYESDANGKAVVGGHIADCDVNFCAGVWLLSVNWGGDSWATNKANYVSIGSEADFAIYHHQPDNGVYVVTAGSSNSEWGEDSFRNLNIGVVEGKTYTFSALWKAGANDKTQIQINGVSITNGQYNVQNGATYNPFTGRIAYTFTATSNTTSIVLNNRGDNKQKDYSFADPQIYESDANGKAVVGGHIADCDVDFCAGVWSLSVHWGGDSWATNRVNYVSTGTEADFAVGHLQPDNGVYVVTAGPSNSGSEWGQDVFRNLNIGVVEGKTYTFSALWKAGANDKTQIQINGVSITNGRYNVQNGATYNPFTGRITYTFTATSNTTSISLNNRDESIKRKDYSFADPQIYESDANGKAVVGGHIADCDVDFCAGVWSLSVNWGGDSWASKKANYVGTGTETDFITTVDEECSCIPVDPELGDVVIAGYPINNWDMRLLSYQSTIIAGKKYTFSILWKDLGGSKSILRVNGTNILEGGNNFINGATFDPDTGRLSYTFTATKPDFIFELDNLGDNKYNKNYEIADPKLYEVDANGVAMNNGHTVNCHTAFCPEKWIIKDQSYAICEDDTNFMVRDGYASDFAIRKNHSQLTDNNVYALSYKYSYNARKVENSVYAFKGKTYTFNMLWKVYGNTKTKISVDGTMILDGDYNVLNGATFDPYTGRLSYTFTATDDSVELVLDNMEADYKYNSYSVADPQMYESDLNGNPVADGDIADCDVDFCKWSWRNYNTTGQNSVLEARETLTVSDFVIRTNHTQPKDSTYVLSYDYDDWTKSQLIKNVWVYKGKTYTFNVLWRDLTKTTKISVNGIEIMNGADAQNGAIYDYKSGLLSYTFTAQDSIITLKFDNLDEARKNHAYSIANPQMYETDAEGNKIANGDVADCDVDFCGWTEYGSTGSAITPNFVIAQNDELLFEYENVKLGDVNGDGEVDIRDLIALKKVILGVYNKEINAMCMGYSSKESDIKSTDLVLLRKVLLRSGVGRDKSELLELIDTLYNGDGYAIGYNSASSTRISAGIETFKAKTGEKPAYVDFDMFVLPYINEANTDYVVSQLAKHSAEGGFIALSAHWVKPTINIKDTYKIGAANSRYALTAEEYKQVYTSGNDIYNNFREELAIEAEFIKQLKDLGINVIYRPLHESNYGEFWWCSNDDAGITPAMVIELYNYVYNYFTVECGLDNIVWQFNIDAKKVISDLEIHQNVDLLSLDFYPINNDFTLLNSVYTSLKKLNNSKPIAISEFFSSATSTESYAKDLGSALNTLSSNFTGKIAYLGIYCTPSSLSECTLPEHVLTLDDIANICR